MKTDSGGAARILMLLGWPLGAPFGVFCGFFLDFFWVLFSVVSGPPGPADRQHLSQGLPGGGA